MFKLRTLIVPVTIALVVGLPSVLAIQHHMASAQPPIVLPPEVQVTHPTRADVPVSSTLSGTLSPYLQAKLYAKVPGYLKAIYVDKGDRVHTGELLAVIDAPELQSAMSAARSQVTQAQANLLEKDSSYQKAVAERHLNVLAYERLKEARQSSPDLIAPMEVDVAQAKAEQSVAEVATAKSEIAVAKAELASAQDHVEEVSAQLAYTRITAPFDGVVSARYLDPGAMVQTGTNSASQAMPVVEVMDPSRLRLDVHVAETDVPDVKPGTPASVELPAVPGAARQATIVRTSVAEDLGTRTMLAEAEIANRDLGWHPGMYAQVNLQLQVHRGALTLPEQAITRNGDKANVFVVGTDSRLHQRSVELGADDGIHVEIKRGLAANDAIALTGTESLHDGMEVRHG